MCACVLCVCCVTMMYLHLDIKGVTDWWLPPTLFFIRLMAALEPTKSFEELKEPKWTKSGLIELMAVMVRDNWILPYCSACATFGKSTVNSLIKYNIVHLRPSSRMSFDVPRHETPTITAESPAALIAMRKELESCESSQVWLTELVLW